MKYYPLNLFTNCPGAKNDGTVPKSHAILAASCRLPLQCIHLPECPDKFRKDNMFDFRTVPSRYCLGKSVFISSYRIYEV